MAQMTRRPSVGAWVSNAVVVAPIDANVLNGTGVDCLFSVA
jgi:hypothetical protein